MDEEVLDIVAQAHEEVMARLQTILVDFELFGQGTSECQSI